MKKILGLVMSAVMALSLGATSALASSSTPGSQAAPAKELPKIEDPKAEITVSADKSWIPYYQAAIDRLKAKYPESKITIKDVAAFDVFTIIDSTDATNPDVPDVFAIPADRLYTLNKKEALAPLDAKAIAEVLGGYENFDEGLGGNLKIGEDYMAFPMNIETLAVFYNPVNAKAEGIDPAKPIDFKDAKELSILIPAHDAWFGVSLANAVGINFLSNEGGQFQSDLVEDFANLAPEKKAVIETLYNYWKVADQKGPELWDKDKAGSFIDEQFKDGGKGVFRIDGPWATANLQKLAPSVDVAPLSNITVNGQPLKHWQGGWGLAINSRNEADPAKMALATELIKEILNPAYAEDYFKATGKIMLNVKAETYAASANLSEIDKKVIAAIIESYNNAEKRPLFDEWGQVWPSWQNALLSWNSTKPQTVEDAYKTIQDSFKTMMAGFGQ